ncbi:hypothetical protein [Xenorhabdus bovienii]|uniref:hypothetical protein n=1 Tax=Xenorhabdus bovienii TaxID=40576 RepID=UPI0023B2B500|nr:hypothetical protein [Xenorhabdus bovienii]
MPLPFHLVPLIAACVDGNAASVLLPQAFFMGDQGAVCGFRPQSGHVYDECCSGTADHAGDGQGKNEDRYFQVEHFSTPYRGLC